jgi:hypothetical protein
MRGELSVRPAPFLYGDILLIQSSSFSGSFSAAVRLIALTYTKYAGGAQDFFCEKISHCMTDD